MAISYLPKPPKELVEMSKNVSLYLQELDRLLNNSESIEWDRVNKDGSSLADLATKLHSDLDQKQGGTSGEHYHLTEAQHAQAVIQATDNWQGKDFSSVGTLGVDVLNASTVNTDEMNYTDTYWDDMRVPVNSVRVPGSKQPTWAAWLTGLQLLIFSDQAVAGNEEEVYFAIQWAHNYKLGTDIYPHVHWVPDDAGAGTVRWGLEYSWANINDVFPATTTIYAEDATNSTADQHLIADFSTIDWSTNDGVSAMLSGRLFRNSSHANDTYTGGAGLLDIDFHYEIDSPGSRQETVK